MAKAASKTTTYADVPNTRRPPYFGEREPQSVTAVLAVEGGLRVAVKRFPEWKEIFDDVKLPRGRPPIYDRAAIIAVAEELVAHAHGPDKHLDWFVERVGNLLAERHIKAPKPTVLTEICAQVYRRAKG
jgi:hypothetical protein